jgi:hypothetical protein
VVTDSNSASAALPSPLQPDARPQQQAWQESQARKKWDGVARSSAALPQAPSEQQEVQLEWVQAQPADAPAPWRLPDSAREKLLAAQQVEQPRALK